MTTPRRLGALGLVVLLAVVLAFDRSSVDVSSAPLPQPLTGLYGSAIAMDSKNNETVGGPALQRVSYRFRASVDLRPGLRGRHPAWRAATTPDGDGGSMRISVESDVDGHPSGRPRWPACRSDRATRRRRGNGATG